MSSYVLRTPVTVNDPSLKLAVRDKLLEDSNNGVLFAADLAFPWCYPAGDYTDRPPSAAPTDNAQIRDITEKNNAKFVGVDSGVSFAGNGFDFSGITETGIGIEIPHSTVTNKLFLNQEFLVCLYMKLPTEVDWSHGNAGLQPFFTSTISGEMYTRYPDLLTMSQYSDKTINIHRQHGSDKKTDIIGFNAGSVGVFGKFVQIGFWIKDNKNNCSVTTEDGIVHNFSKPYSGKNLNDFSSNPIYVGGSTSMWHSVDQDALSSYKYRMYRFFIEDLSVSNRDPVETLQADFARTIARNVFS